MARDVERGDAAARLAFDGLVEAAPLHGVSDVRVVDAFAAAQIRDGARKLEDAVVSALSAVTPLKI